MKKILILMMITSSLIYAERIPTSMDIAMKRMCEDTVQNIKPKNSLQLIYIGRANGIIEMGWFSHTKNHTPINLQNKSELIHFVCTKTART